MKKVILSVVALVMAMGSSAFAGGNSLGAGSKSLGVETNGGNTTIVMGKYGISQDMAVVGGFGFASRDTGAATNGKSTEIDLQAGVRKYLKVDDFAPFVEGDLAYASNTGGASDITGWSIMAGFGAEYFLAKQFSLEGSAGVVYSSTSTKPAGGTSVTGSTFGTARSAIAFNFYF